MHKASPRPVKCLFVVWKGYQRRAEVLAPLLDADTLFLPHVFRSRYLRPVDYLLKLVTMTVRILRTKPDFVVVQAPPLFAALPALLTNVPYIIDAHNGVFQSFWGKLPLAPYLMHKAEGIIVHNAEVLALARGGYPTIMFYVISDPLQLIKLADRTARREQRFLFICSFDEDEPIDTIIQVIEALPEYEFVITADVKKLPREQRWRLQCCRNLHLTGYLSTQDYHALLCSSTAAIALTTQEATQQSGACEALSSDTPLIVSKTALSDALFGPWAVLVDNTPEAVIQAIRSLKCKPLDLSSYRARWNEEVMQGIRVLQQNLGEARVSQLAGGRT